MRREWAAMGGGGAGAFMHSVSVWGQGQAVGAWVRLLP